MAKLGILATAGVSGDLPPVMALALGLAERGHRVEFLAGQELASIAEGVGLRATITDPKHDVGPQILHAVREAQGMDLGAQGDLIDRRLREWEENLAQVVGDWAGRERLDAVLGPLFAVGVCRRAIPEQRWCVVNSTYSLDPATLGEDCTPRALPLLARFAALLEHAPLVLHATDAIYDRDRELPPTQHHVGPLFWELPATVPAWVNEPGDPWVLISLSTLAQDDLPIVRLSLPVLADRPVRVLVTLGPHDPGDLGPLPPNARVEGFVPHSAVLPRSTLLVSHAGHGSVMKAMWHGVPMVLVPWGRDQPGVAARAATLGVAQVVQRESLSETTMSAAVGRVLDDEHFSAAARAVSSRLRQQDPVARACELVESLSRGRRPE